MLNEIRWAVTSCMDYGECMTVEGVFSSEELAEAFIKSREGDRLHYYAAAHYTDSPEVEVEYA